MSEMAESLADLSYLRPGIDLGIQAIDDEMHDLLKLSTDLQLCLVSAIDSVSSKARLFKVHREVADLLFDLAIALSLSKGSIPTLAEMGSDMTCKRNGRPPTLIKARPKPRADTEADFLFGLDSHERSQVPDLVKRGRTIPKFRRYLLGQARKLKDRISKVVSQTATASRPTTPAIRLIPHDVSAMNDNTNTSSKLPISPRSSTVKRPLRRSVSSPERPTSKIPKKSERDLLHGQLARNHDSNALKAGGRNRPENPPVDKLIEYSSFGGAMREIDKHTSDQNPSVRTIEASRPPQVFPSTTMFKRPPPIYLPSQHKRETDFIQSRVVTPTVFTTPVSGLHPNQQANSQRNRIPGSLQRGNAVTPHRASISSLAAVTSIQRPNSTAEPIHYREQPDTGRPRYSKPTQSSARRSSQNYDGYGEGTSRPKNQYEW